MKTTHLFLILLFSFLPACQPQVLVQRGVVVNKTNPYFLREVGVDEMTNPHKSGNCQVCHLAPSDLLTKEKSSENELLQKKQMRTDSISLCTTCHKAAIESEHRVGIGTKLNKENLPLNHQGDMTCATTCHDMHTKEPALTRYLLRKPFDTLCLSCHDV